MIFLSFLFYLILSKNSEICGNIIADYDVMQILSAPLLSQKLGMIDSVGNLQTTNFEQSIQLGLINEYGKYGLILAFGKSQNYKIDISQFDQNVNWIQVMYDIRLNLLIPPTLELKIRDGQVINLSVIDISVTLEIVPATDSHKKSSLLDNKILEQNYVQNDPIAEENTENENYTKNLNSTTTNKNSTKVGNTGNATNNGLSNNNKAKLHLQSLKLSNSATILKLDQIECRYFFVHISSSMLGSLSCIMSAMKVNISNDEVLTSIPSIFGDSLVHYIFDGLTYEQLFIEYKLTSLACNMTIRPIDDITELKDVTILFDQIYDDTTQMYLPSDLFYADFDGWEKIKFTNKIPTLTFLQDLKIEYADPPENLYVQQFQKNGHNIVYQNPISIDEVFICNQYCPDGIKESHDRLLIYISSEEEVEFWLNSIDMTTTQNIYLFSPIPIGSSRPISLAGVPKIANLYIQGAQYMTEAGTIEYSLFNVDVDEFVSVENLVVDHVTLNANGLSKMKVNALYIQEYGVIKGRINVQNAYVNFDDFTNSFDSITLEKLNLQLNLTSHAELTYDTRGWEFSLADGKSVIIVLSSSTAVANSVCFHIYTDGNYTIVLTLRRIDIKSIKGLEFVIYPGLQSSDRYWNTLKIHSDSSNEFYDFVNENNYENSFQKSQNDDIHHHLEFSNQYTSNQNNLKFSSNLLIEKHGINQVRIENSNLIHSNHKRKQIKLPKRDNKVYKVDFIFNTDSWVDNRIGYCEMIFNAAIMTIVSVDESSAPDNFKLIIQSSAIDPTITEEVNETTPGPDYEFDERRSSFVINLVIGITIPAFLIIVGIVIYFVFLRFRNNDSDDQNNQLIPNEGQEN